MFLRTMEPAPPLGDAPITAMERGVNKGSSFQGDFFTGDSFVRRSGECLAAFWFGTPAVFCCSLYELKFIMRKYEVRQKKSSGRAEKGEPCRKIFAFFLSYAVQSVFCLEGGMWAGCLLPPRLAWGGKAARPSSRIGTVGGKAGAGRKAGEAPRRNEDARGWPVSVERSFVTYPRMDRNKLRSASWASLPSPVSPWG